MTAGENLLSALNRTSSTDGQTARMPAVVSVSTSSSTISQPCDAAYEQAALNSGIFLSVWRTRLLLGECMPALVASS